MDLHRVHVLNDRWVHVICSLDLSYTWCNTGAYFRFGWDLLIFMEVTCATIDDFMSFCSSDLSRIWCHAGAYFCFRWDLLIFMEVTCATIDDFMSFCYLDLSCTWRHTRAHFPFQMRFMDLHGCRMFDDRWFHVARSSTYHTFDAMLGRIADLDEIYRSWWSCVLIPIYETCAGTTFYPLSLWWFLNGASHESPR